jgi:hypothetical protein
VRAAALITAGVLAAALAGAPRHGSQQAEAQYLADVKYLTSADLRGRGTGSSGLDKAARYIERQFRAAGLSPASGKEYCQPFEVTVNPRLGAVNTLRVSGAAGEQELELAREWTPLNISASGTFEGNVVFAGYGITAPEYGYDDYAGIDATGKAVVVLRHEPQEYESASIFEGRIYTEHSQVAAKAANARRHGARALIVVNDTANHSTSDGLEVFTALVGPGDPGLPYLQVKAELVEGWFQASGRDFKFIQTEIDRELTSHAFAFPASLRLSLTTEIARERREVCNVGAYLPGASDEYVVVGAHYDHLGSGEQFSLAPAEKGKLHPGADDNASGTAGVLALARQLAAETTRSGTRRRGVLFITFAGEELGLLGSGHYVRNPLRPIENAVAMINMDMIGRVRDGRVTVGGVASGEGLQALIAEVERGSELTLDSSDQAVYGSSDHTSFLTRQVPVLFFFSGLHSDYHKPSDTWDKIEVGSTAKLLDVVERVVISLLDMKERPRFVRRSGALPNAAVLKP